jgi:hypothetical protein
VYGWRLFYLFSLGYLIDLSHALSAVLGTKWTAILPRVNDIQLKPIRLPQSFAILHSQHPDIPRR